jgi:hypothetical protein
VPVELSAALPQLELGPGATVEVDSGDPSAIVSGLIVYGTYYPPGGGPGVPVDPIFVPVPIDGAG